ncbi:MAG: bifunctional phosphoglucose/phosphomannose isomerase [Candidatus Paceibacterota bacterium]
MARESIESFSKQLEYEPQIENADNFKTKDKFVVVGMGGSNLTPGLFQIWKPELDVLIHKDYGLPEGDLKDRLVIVSSYSGKTEEALDAFNVALERKLDMVAITTGGKLLDMAKENNVPHVLMPDIGVHPRFAVGLSLMAMAKAFSEENALKDLKSLAGSFDPADYEEKGKQIAEKLKDKIPVIYSSRTNSPLVYCWKVKFNESAKTPVSYNVFPELNHTEMAGLDSESSKKLLADKLQFIFLKDSDDDDRIQKRFDVTAKLYQDRGFSAEIVEIEGDSKWKKILSSLLTADWASLHLAEMYGVNAEDTSMIEDFKKSII